jgi:hypothetical protein
MNNREDFTELIDTYDESRYDTEAMHMDARHGNFSPDEAWRYKHENIVAESMTNGQWSQARKQCEAYGLTYEEQAVANGHNPWK